MPDEHEPDEAKRRGVLQLFFAGAALAVGAFTTAVSGVNYFAERISASETANSNHDRQFESVEKQLVLIRSEIDKIEAQLESFKAPGGRFTQADGQRLEEQIVVLRERLAAEAATNAAERQARKQTKDR